MQTSIAGHDESTIQSITHIESPWHSSSPRTIHARDSRAALSATRRRCRICAIGAMPRRHGILPRPLEAFAEIGFAGLLVPKNFGGSGLAASSRRGDGGDWPHPDAVAVSFDRGAAASRAVRGGSEAQSRRICRRFSDGSLWPRSRSTRGQASPLQTQLQAVRSAMVQA